MYVRFRVREYCDVRRFAKFLELIRDNIVFHTMNERGRFKAIAVEYGSIAIIEANIRREQIPLVTDKLVPADTLEEAIEATDEWVRHINEDIRVEGCVDLKPIESYQVGVSCIKIDYWVDIRYVAIIDPVKPFIGKMRMLDIMNKLFDSVHLELVRSM